MGEYFNMRSHITTARQQAGVKTSRHVPTNIQGCNYYRNRVVESMQKLHSLTWEISVRRVNCFSQVSAQSFVNMNTYKHVRFSSIRVRRTGSRDCSNELYDITQ